MRVSPLRPRQRTEPARRNQLLRAFARSGLSAAAFARQHQLNYTTFCAWRHRQIDRPGRAPDFVEIELAPSASSELVIELGRQARLCIHSAAQLELAARLLHTLNAQTAC
jgi:transposase-like protein